MELDLNKCLFLKLYIISCKLSIAGSGLCGKSPTIHLHAHSTFPKKCITVSGACALTYPAFHEFAELAKGFGEHLNRAMPSSQVLEMSFLNWYSPLVLSSDQRSCSYSFDSYHFPFTSSLSLQILPFSSDGHHSYFLSIHRTENIEE